MRPKISVVVPCYKVEKYLPECVNSLAGQTLGEIEILLVDDGSPDGSGRICDEYAAGDGRIRVIHKENGGVSAARNDGMLMACGEYVIFVDSDDYLPSDALEKLYGRAKETDADMVIGDISRVTDGAEQYARFYDRPFVTEDRAYIDRLIRTVFYNRYCPDPYRGAAAFGYGGPCNKLVRRELLLEHEIKFDTRVRGIFDDIIYSAYILAVSRRIAYIPELVYYYRILETSITQIYKSDMPEINAAIFTVWQEFMGRYNMDGKFTAAYYANVLRRFDDSLGKYYFSKKNPRSKITVLRGLKKAMMSEPYSLIPQYAETEKLSQWHRILVNQISRGSAAGIWASYHMVRLAVKMCRR